MSPRKLHCRALHRRAKHGSRSLRCALALAALVSFAACASELPVSTSFDHSGGEVTVEVGADGFVRTGERRLPLDALLLELRQAARRMSDAERSAYMVRIVVDPALPLDGEPARRARTAVNRLLDELDIMDFGQAVLL